MLKRIGKIVGASSLVALLLLSVGCSNSSISENIFINNDIATDDKKDDVLVEENLIEKTEEAALKNESKKLLEAEIHFIDVGNADAILIKQEGANVLIDGGNNQDEKTVVDYLKKEGVNELEYIIATHPHADHIGGLDNVIRNIKVNHVLVSNGSADTKTYRDFILALSEKGITPSVPLKNAIFNLTENSYIKILSCANVEDPNNQSIVALYVNGEDKVLFTGDAEEEIIAQINEDIDLLKTSHHGSYNGTTKSFLEKITPSFAVITVGKDNSYGHPHKSTMELLKSFNIPVFRTDEGGTIIFKSSGTGLSTECNPNSYLEGKSQEKETTNADSINVDNNSETVYWTPNGSVYHKTKGCSSLSNSKTILSGTTTESGKSRGCKNCY